MTVSHATKYLTFLFETKGWVLGVLAYDGVGGFQKVDGLIVQKGYHNWPGVLARFNALLDSPTRCR